VHVRQIIQSGVHRAIVDGLNVRDGRVREHPAS
jgi:hypothetical protein